MGDEVTCDDCGEVTPATCDCCGALTPANPDSEHEE